MNFVFAESTIRFHRARRRVCRGRTLGFAWRGHDGLNRLTSAHDGANVAQGSYAYDKTGNRTASGQLVTTMGMDCTGTQPGEPCTPTGPVSTWTTRTYDYLPNDHRVLAIGNTERHYDAAGNTIWIGPRSIEFVPPPNDDPPPGDPLESAAYEGTEQAAIGLDDGNPPPGIATKTFAYNAANRMASVSENGDLLMSYRYSGAGERVYRSGSGQTAHTVFDPSGQWLGDYDEYGQVIQQAIWLDNLPVGLLARLDGGERRVFYLQPDALGTPRVVIDPTRGTQGTAVWRWELEDEAFGETDPNQDPDGDNTLFVLDMRYPGQQHDSATGFNYNYFRDYDASIGRYVQSDPIGLRGGLSTYVYVYGNPFLMIDRYGLDGVRVDYHEMYNQGQRDAASVVKNNPAFFELVKTYREMIDKNVPESDQFFHCLGACRAVKAGGDPSSVMSMLRNKERTDYLRALVGQYGKKDMWGPEAHYQMVNFDMPADMEVNEIGATCPSNTTCNKRCSYLLDRIDKKYRQYMTSYRPDWK